MYPSRLAATKSLRRRIDCISPLPRLDASRPVPSRVRRGRLGRTESVRHFNAAFATFDAVPTVLRAVLVAPATAPVAVRAADDAVRVGLCTAPFTIFRTGDPAARLGVTPVALMSSFTASESASTR